MSSDSDSDLSFESADEGSQKEDRKNVNLSDLSDISDFEGESSNKIVNVASVRTKSYDSEPEIKNSTIHEDDKKPENEDLIQKFAEKFDNKLKLESETSIKQENFTDLDDKYDIKQEFIKIESKIDESGWNEADFSDIEESNEPLEVKETSKIPAKLDESKQEHSSWSWSKFGTSILNTATTLTTTVLNTVESTIGAPDPLELAKIEQSYANEESINKTDLNEWNTDNNDWFTALPLNKLATSGKQLVLESLENVGKRTIQILNDKDPDFKSTRELLKKATDLAPSKPNLSQLLKEAKESSTVEELFNKSCERPCVSIKKPKEITFSTCFDDYKGLVYLEALEMLSRQMNSKVEMNSNKKNVNLFDKYDRIFDTNEILNEDNDDNDTEMFNFVNFSNILSEYASKLSVKVSIDGILASFKQTSNQSSEKTAEIKDKAIKALALITSKLIEFYHKLGECMIVQLNDSTTKSKNCTFKQAEILLK